MPLLSSADTYQATINGTGRQPVTPAFITWGDPNLDPPHALGSASFDVVMVEEHERAAEVTDHAVEEGVNIVDHVRPLADRVTLEVFVSNSPISSADGQFLPLTLDLPQPGQGGLLAGGTGAIIGKGLQAIGLQKGYPQQITAHVLQFAGETDYVRVTYEVLTYLRDTATLINVYCPQATYQNMILERIQLHRDATTGTSGNFTLEFRQIRVVSSSITDAPVPSLPQAAQEISKGKKDANPATTQMKSLGAAGMDAVTGGGLGAAIGGLLGGG